MNIVNTMRVCSPPSLPNALRFEEAMDPLSQTPRPPAAAGERRAGRERGRRSARPARPRRRATGAAIDRDNRRSMASVATLSHVYPLGSRVNERGHLEIGGCDVIELAERFGTPAYVVAEDDLRARARAFLAAFRAAGAEDFEVVFASKAFPATRGAARCSRRRGSAATSPRPASCTSRCGPASIRRSS